MGPEFPVFDWREYTLPIGHTNPYDTTISPDAAQRNPGLVPQDLSRDRFQALRLIKNMSYNLGERELGEVV